MCIYAKLNYNYCIYIYSDIIMISLAPYIVELFIVFFFNL